MIKNPFISSKEEFDDYYLLEKEGIELTTINGFNEVLSPEIITHIFEYLDEKSLFAARNVCNFWNSCVEGFPLIKKEKATRKLFEAIIKGEVKFAELCLKNGANVNVTFPFRSTSGLQACIFSFEKCNLLHALIYTACGGLQNFFNIGMDKYIKIFQLLIKHGININYSASGKEYTEFGCSDITRIPIRCLVGDFDNNTFRFLLLLRQAEINLERNKVLNDDRIETFINSIADALHKTEKTFESKTNKDILNIFEEYLENIKQNQKGFCYAFSEAEIAILAQFVPSLRTAPGLLR